MYATIDKHAMRFVHVHEDHRVVSKLADLELPHVPVSVREIDLPRHFEDLTMLELRTLYRNTVGIDYHSYYRPNLVADLAEVARSLAPLDVNLIELLAQCNALPPGDEGRYRYVKGSLRPLPVADLFELPAASRSAVPRSTPTPAPVAALPAAPAPTPAPPRREPAVRPAGPRAAPSGGSVTEQIFAECEAQLKDLHNSGAAVALAEKGALFQAARKRAIDVLDARGININSARKGSSMWVQSKR